MPIRFPAAQARRPGAPPPSPFQAPQGAGTLPPGTPPASPPTTLGPPGGVTGAAVPRTGSATPGGVTGATTARAAAPLYSAEAVAANGGVMSRPDNRLRGFTPEGTLTSDNWAPPGSPLNPGPGALPPGVGRLSGPGLMSADPSPGIAPGDASATGAQGFAGGFGSGRFGAGMRGASRGLLRKVFGLGGTGPSQFSQPLLAAAKEEGGIGDVPGLSLGAGEGRSNVSQAALTRQGVAPPNLIEAMMLIERLGGM